MSIQYKLSEAQSDFSSLNGKVPNAVAMVGAKGSGKTFAGALFIANCIASLPNTKGVFACATIRQTNDIWEQNIEPLLKSLSWPYEHNKQEGIVRLPYFESMLHLRSAETPTRIESMEYAWGWADEVSLYSFDFLMTFSSRIRSLNGTGFKRFSSMPDDPAHQMYNYFETSCDQLHELTLKDNRNKSFVEAYTKELKNVYSGAMLDRYLHGKRVSLDGMGVFYLNEDHRIQTKWSKQDELIFSWDFNVEYCAVSVWQIAGRNSKAEQILHCLASHQMKGETVYQSAKQLARMYKDHSADVILIGDASGENRSAMATGSMWTQVNQAYEEVFTDRVYNQVPNANPHEKDTVECFNWAAQKRLIAFDRDQAQKMYVALTAAKYDKHGKIDKKDDYKANVPKTHEVDTARYAAYHAFKYAYKGDIGEFEVI